MSNELTTNLSSQKANTSIARWYAVQVASSCEKDTIMITAIDSLNNCCLLGHTTSLSSSNVEVKKFFFFFGSFISEGSFLRGS